MGVDYYKILQVDTNADHDNLRVAFMKLSVKWHPIKHPDNVNEAQSKFKQICEAYEVLIDPEKRAVYDKYGEEVVKGQVPPPSDASGDAATTPFRFNLRSAEEIFAEFYGISTPFTFVGLPIWMAMAMAGEPFVDFL